ncbi:unnamed protein product [Parajaminaea phylloscopi]
MPLSSEKGNVTLSPASSTSGEQVQKGHVTYSAEEEAKLVRKVDFLVLPTLSVLYLLSFLDRSNIGNAKIDGMAQDLKLGTQYSTALTLFFVGYVLFELPANWGLKATNPPFWMPFITFLFGAVSLCQGLVTNASGLLAIRFLLGVAEAGLFPGTVYIFSQWYQRKERVVRVCFFFSAAAVAGAFGGVLAYGIGKMDGVGGRRGWQWIFILEGLLTCVVAVGAFFTIPNYPTKTKWFSPRELEILHDRLARDSDALELENFNWSGVRQAVTDVKVYLYCFLFGGMSFALYTISLFLPTIIVGMGYKSWQSQLLTVPPYVLGFIVTMSSSWTSMRVGKRAPFILAGFALAAIGYIVLLTSPTVAGKYVSVFLIVAGVYSGNGILLAWPSENIAGATKRNTALAMQISFGNGFGAIVGTQLYRTPLGGLPNKNFHVSIGLTFVWLAIGASCCAALWVILARENKRRAALLQERYGDEAQARDLAGNKTREEVAEEWARLGDKRVEFVYQI